MSAPNMPSPRRKNETCKPKSSKPAKRGRGSASADASDHERIVEQVELGRQMASADTHELSADGVNKLRAGCWAGGKAIAVWLAMEPSRFLLDDERASAWGLDPTQEVMVRIEFDHLYTNGTTPPKVSAGRHISNASRLED